MKYVYLLLLAFLIVGCDDTPDNDTTNDTTIEDESPLLFSDQSIVRHLESKLEIPATEDYTYAIYREHINGDDSLDYIVTVNLLDRAINNAVRDDALNTRSEQGFMGNYNFIILVDGAKKTFAEPLSVPSSAYGKLSVSFENIRSEAYKDIVIDYRIINACYRRFFTVLNGVARETFDTKIFSGLGDENPEAFDIRYATGTYSLAKDILIYKANLEEIQLEDPKKIYSIDPKITATEELERRWYFHDAQKKYFTQNP